MNYTIWSVKGGSSAVRIGEFRKKIEFVKAKKEEKVVFGFLRCFSVMNKMRTL